ncbi:MAG: hypothetical protein KKC76_16545 [Proteobacteria bacterium]|nr:hypothetical protein [Pseudomonadota bacterium]MBU4295436.1 hypothetical protein [Pseudomonadota bacterium]MCG2747906.1 hypothetical protein [Desulfobulbaceae bacterium]
MTESENQRIRQAIVEALPTETSKHGETPEKKEVYVPPSHVKALRLECNLVIGARGVGKTFWSAALRSEIIREMLGRSVADLSKTDVRTGFGEKPNLDSYPDGDVFGNLLSKGIEAYYVWRAVLARWLADTISSEIPRESWDSTVAWVRNQPEIFGRMLERANAKFEVDGRIGMIVFDALDRSSTDWRTMDTIVRDLLRVILSLKRFPRLHGKAFLREDQFVGRQITDFPDASKLLSTRVDLTWAPHDLHGLLWQCLCNGHNDHGVLLREVYKRAVEFIPQKLADDAWAVADSAKRDGKIQRLLFVSIAGEWMGRDRRRGIPYIWTVGHLADGRGRTSPRSFLAAIRSAAEDSFDRHPDHSFPLHYESIKRGVQKASEIRVSELAEDYPWVRTLMEPLRGLTVPCSFDTVEQCWIAKFGESLVAMKSERLPPEHYENGWFGVREDLETLGIFESMKDSRVNMPDLYRVGFGLGRRGGVRPVIRSSGE